jgi:hypothetical protein
LPRFRPDFPPVRRVLRCCLAMAAGKKASRWPVTPAPGPCPVLMNAPGFRLEKTVINCAGATRRDRTLRFVAITTGRD